ncbi:hypothetical protein KVR01_009115 [Diaporthe batatas]|uniref:uncharacterized protein n=1 Tax=Diaporthe batatas TaxID=748121 RepID=UPI001D04FFF3|nr:uncharacterized protein KVR01_009115 [Diaporthe batatas]KAG8160851.1 hypothetical protein KVR01_009115 [Diaporthe batatas]
MPPPWPHGARCAISFTMDNLGEAQAVHNKTWPAGKPTGQDPSVLQTLPRILDILAKTTTTGKGGVRATYFAEAWSLATYPAAVASLQRAGHEVAWHGFQHEVWHALSPGDEQASFERSFAAAREAGVVYRGFRPPGGRINGVRTVGLCGRLGVEYVSPLGEFGILPGGGDGDGDGAGDVVVLPFEWEAVDAFWYMDKFAGTRREHGVQGEGEGEGAPGPAEFRAWLLRRIGETKAEGGYMSILFHPFLTTDEEKMGLLEEVVGLLGRDDEVWCAPCGEVAGWVREHRAEFGF